MRGSVASQCVQLSQCGASASETSAHAKLAQARDDALPEDLPLRDFALLTLNTRVGTVFHAGPGPGPRQHTWAWQDTKAVPSCKLCRAAAAYKAKIYLRQRQVTEALSPSTLPFACMQNFNVALKKTAARV
jgi:hypothetical protein